MKRVFVWIALALIVAGLAVATYGQGLVADLGGCLLTAAGAGLATAVVATSAAAARWKIALIALCWIAAICLAVTGIVIWEGTLITFILGSSALAIFGFLVYRAVPSA